MTRLSWWQTNADGFDWQRSMICDDIQPSQPMFAVDLTEFHREQVGLGIVIAFVIHSPNSVPRRNDYCYDLGMLPEAFTLVNSAVYGVKLPVVVPMALVCVGLVVSIPVAASRGKLHVPGYVGIAIIAFASSLLSGRLAGMRGIAGRSISIFLSVAFFVLLATAAGSILALFVYRHPSDP